MTPLPFAEKDGVAVVQLPARMEQNDWMGMRDQFHRQFIDQGMTRIAIDCESCADLPSIAYGTFNSLSRDLRRVGGSMHLVHVNEKIRQVLVRTRMDQAIPIHGTLTEVIRKPVPKTDEMQKSPRADGEP